MTDASFVGFHQFAMTPLEGAGDPPRPYGSFEVFYRGVGGPFLSKEEWKLKPGWYWWPCFPGCLPDGEPSGPFPTAEGAYLDAIND